MTPIDLRTCTKAEMGVLVRSIPNHRDKITQADITVLGTGSNELSPSFFLKCSSRCYRFNFGEGWMRMANAYQCQVAKAPLSFFTRAHWDACGGAGVIYYQQEVQHKKQHYLGPRKMEQFMRYIQQYTGHWTWVNTRVDNSDRVYQFQDESVKVSMIPVDPVGDNVNAGTLVAYSCRVSDYPGKFFPEKAVELGIPKGPVYRLLTHGRSVLTKQGDLVLPSQVMGDSQKGPTFLVVDCPEECFLNALTSNQHLQPEYYSERGEKVALIVHITPLEILQRESYCKWASGFGRDTDHLFLHASVCPGEVGYRHVNKLIMTMHMLNPSVYHFPCLPAKNVLDKGNLNISKYVNEDSLILGRMLLKYTLKPRVSLDLSDCLESIDKQTKSEFESVKGDPILHRKLVEHRRTLPDKAPLSFGTVLPSLMKNECSVGLTNPNDASVTLLGTSATNPTKYRSCSGILVQTLDDGNFLLDCGEGTLTQLYRCFGMDTTRDILRKMNTIFISHAHADHHFGMIGVLNEIHALTENDSDRHVRLVCGRMQGRCIEKYDVCDNQQVEILHTSELVRRPYPCGDALTMETVPVEHIHAAYGCVLRRRGKWSIVYSGDTVPSRNLVEAGRNATLLIHEATFEDHLLEEAKHRNHCTYSEAVKVGQAMDAGFTITTHFSTRSWWFPLLRQYWRPGVTPGVDMMTVRLSDIHKQKLDSASSRTALNDIAQMLHE